MLRGKPSIDALSRVIAVVIMRQCDDEVVSSLPTSSVPPHATAMAPCPRLPSPTSSISPHAMVRASCPYLPHPSTCKGDGASPSPPPPPFTQPRWRRRRTQQGHDDTRMMHQCILSFPFYVAHMLYWLTAYPDITQNFTKYNLV